MWGRGEGGGETKIKSCREEKNNQISAYIINEDMRGGEGRGGDREPQASPRHY